MDIAAAMGFSSFGGSKKRKFDQSNSPKAKVDVSGANSTLLGVRPKVVASEEQSEIETTSEATQVPHAADVPPGTRSNPQSANTKGKQNQLATTGLASFLARGQDMQSGPSISEETLTAVPPPHGDPAAAEMVSFGGPSISQAELQALRHGVKDNNGNTAYFLPSFVEDPWEKLINRQK